MATCKFCKIDFDLKDKVKGWMANHSRWCKNNPSHKQYTEALIKARSFKTHFENQFTKAKKENRPVPSSPNKNKFPGTFKGKKHTEKAKKLIKQKALASPHRRLKRKIIEYKGVLLDSSWELVLAKRLDELKIKWIRPKPIPWLDNNRVKHHYFPDFYLDECKNYAPVSQPPSKRSLTE
jgi:hypothetical protein